jgi:hypothetical protein
MTTSEKTRVVRSELERACKEFTVRLAPLGFARTKKMYWTRSHPATVDLHPLVPARQLVRGSPQLVRHGLRGVRHPRTER